MRNDFKEKPKYFKHYIEFVSVEDLNEYKLLINNLRTSTGIHFGKLVIAGLKKLKEK